jgi:RNA polymerase sigma-70 factor (ECF subfamily)
MPGGRTAAGWLLWDHRPDPDFPQPDRIRVPTERDEHLGNEESEWLAAAQRGDRPAFARIVDRYWDRLYRWLYQLTRDRHRAEDLTQETFLKALAGLGSFRPGTNFRAWLFRIGHNNFVNLKRGERRHGPPIADEIPTFAVTAPDEAADREVLRLVTNAIGELPTEYRSALLLRAEDGLSFREIAEILQTTEETARWRVFKARQKLMTKLAPELIPGAAGTEP